MDMEHAVAPPEDDDDEDDDDADDMVLDITPNAASSQQSALEALLAARSSLPAMLQHIPPDDETMVELAIALSLQDQVFLLALTCFTHYINPITQL